MFLDLKHTKLEVFPASKQFVLECYRLTNTFPPDEKFGMISQVKRAALSVHLNIAEGCSRKSNHERIRFFEISRGSIIEVDTAFDIALELSYIREESLGKLEEYLLQTFKLLSGLISSSKVH